MAELKTIADVLTDLQEAFPSWKATENTARVWAEYLKEFDNEVILEAVKRFILTTQTSFPPVLPDILNIAREIKAAKEAQFNPSSDDWRRQIKL